MKKDIYIKLILLLAFITLFAIIGGSFAFADQREFETSARSAIVMEQTSGRIFYEKNSDEHLPMASTTKIVTALTVIENCDLDETVQIPNEACGIEGSSIYLRQGEHLTVRELLYGLMLRSGNDAAVALAIHAGGSIEEFAVMMNETARKLGCEDSNFTNPHGLHDDNHYTSARDLAVITCKALSNPDFKKIVSARTARIANEGYEYDRVLVNKNKLLAALDGADGVKTGFTKKAGRCFVGSATRNGMQVVVVVLNCGPMFEETAAMLDAAFAHYSLQVVIPLNKICGCVTHNGNKTYYFCPCSFAYPVKEDESISVEMRVDNVEQKIRASINEEIIFEQQLIPLN